MKKLLIVLLALLAFSICVFGQDATMPAPKPLGTFTSWNTGTALLYNQVGSATATTGWGPNWNKVPGIDQEWNFGYAGNNFGYSATIEFGMDNLGNTGNPTVQAPSVSWFQTYYNFGKFLTVAVGKFRQGEYRNQGSLVEGEAGEFFGNQDFGVELTVMPITGLSATVLDRVQNGTFDIDYANNLAFGAQYSMAGMFTVNGMYRLIDKYFSASVSTTPVKGLTIVAGASVPDSGGQTFYGSAGYMVMQNLTVNGDVAYKNASTASIGTELQAEYGLGGNYSVGLRAGYDDGKGINIYGNNLGDISGSGVLIYPYAKASFDNGSFIQLGVAYETGANGADAQIQVPLFYLWSF